MKKILLIILVLFSVQCFGATVYLHHFDTTLADVTFNRVTSTYHAAAVALTPSLSHTKKRLGYSSLYCPADANTAYAYSLAYYTNTASCIDTDSDYTIEFWHYPASPGTSYYHDKFPVFKDTSAIFQITMQWSSSFPTKIWYNLFYKTGSVIKQLTTTSEIYGFATNSWHKIATTRKDNTVYFFIDGKLYDSNTDSTTVNPNLSTFYFAGEWTPFQYYQTAQYFDEFRISNECLYTSDFTSETKEFVYPLFYNINFKEDGRLNFKEDGKLEMKFSGGF